MVIGVVLPLLIRIAGGGSIVGGVRIAGGVCVVAPDLTDGGVRVVAPDSREVIFVFSIAAHKRHKSRFIVHHYAMNLISKLFV
jgi:hypothetical protein